MSGTDLDALLDLDAPIDLDGIVPDVIPPVIIPPPPTNDAPAPITTGLIWYSADGTQSWLTGFTDGVTVLQGVHGLEMPAIRTNRAPVAGRPGTLLQSVQHDLRTVELPVFFDATSPEQLRALLAQWLYRLDPRRGNGELWFVATSGTRRLTCRYQEGLEAVEDGDLRQLQAVLVFGADDPYWYDYTPSTLSWSLSGVVPHWFDQPFLPLSFGISSVLGTNTIFNVGDVETWPKYTIDGPADAVTVTNELTNESFTWAHALAAGEQLVIDTKPGIKTVLLNGASAFQYLTSWQLFALAPRENIITVSLAGADVGSNVAVEWSPAHLGPA